MDDVITDIIPEEDIVNTKEILQRTGIQPGNTAADFGCGREALFTTAAAEIVTSTGVVYALDVVKDILAIIEEKVEGAGLHNVITVWTDLEVLGAAKKILDGTVDVGILSDTLFQSQKRQDMIAECLRMVKPGGKLLVVEWKPTNTPLGPPVENRVHPDEIKQICSSFGMQLLEEFEAGEYHWGQIYQR